MIRVNRIGNKLGLAGLLGIALSIGVVGNQFAAETSVTESNRQAAVAQNIADNALTAQSALRAMQLATRGLRLALTDAEVDKSWKSVQAAKTALDKSLDSASPLVLKVEDRERFTKIRALTNDYIASSSDIANLQKKMLELYGRRNAAFLDWKKQLNQLNSSAAATKAKNWLGVIAYLRDADIAINAARAAAWRFANVNEPAQRAEIAQQFSALTEALSHARASTEDKATLEALALLADAMKTQIALSDEVLKNSDTRASIAGVKTLPTANAAS